MIWGAWTRGFTLVALSIGMIGCGAIATRQPLYDANKEPIFDPRLIGQWEWVGAGGLPAGMIQISRGAAKTYLLAGIDSSDESTAPAKADLVRIGKYNYLFFRSSGQGTLLLPCYRVEIFDHGKELHLRFLNTFYIGQYLQAHPGTLRYDVAPSELWARAATRPASEPSAHAPASTQPTPQNLILTDEAPKIRRFLIRHQDDRDWFFHPWILYRLTSSTQGPRG